MAQLSYSSFSDFFRYYRGLPHQQAALQTLYSSLQSGFPVALEEESAWVKQYRTTPPSPVFTNPLDVPYQSQNDNQSGQGYRECFSSSCAMVAMFYKAVKNDDEYNKIRTRYGDTTDAQAQIHALRYLGLKANMITNATSAQLEAQIKEGRPTPVGWLHKGTVTNPTGGGHWAVTIGHTDTHWILNDPNGEADLVNGGYVNAFNGGGIAYSRQNWNKRWLIEGTASGWMMDIRK